ncbi:hypothetical protein DYQ93_03190 [Xanthomonas sp. LMG 8992]|nr:hypothetical protein [Xanthomonas sp. LMG 8992]
MRVRQAKRHADPTARGFARTLIRPCGAPSPEGRRRNRSPSPVGRGVGVRVRRAKRCADPTARGFARTLIRPCGAPSPEKGAMVPEG